MVFHTGKSVSKIKSFGMRQLFTMSVFYAI